MRHGNAIFAILVLGLSGCHLVMEFDDSEVPTTERRSLTFDQESDVAGIDLLVVVDTRSASDFVEFELSVRMFIGSMLQPLYLSGDGGDATDIDPIGGPLHVGFVSSDLGTPEAYPLPAGCTEVGHGASLIPPHVPAAEQGHYLQPFLVLGPEGNGDSGMGNMRVLNYRDAQGDAVEIPFTQALAHQWAGVTAATSTCPFQQPLNAAQKALEYHVENLGFYREEAALGILIISPGDDCSSNPMDPTALFSSDSSLGTLDAFRCFAHGVQCSEGDLASSGLKSDCQDLLPYDGDGPDGRVMVPAESYRAHFEAKKDGRPYVAAAVSGPTYIIEVAQDPQGAPQLLPSLDCAPGGISTYPAVRLRSFVGEDIEDPFDPGFLPESLYQDFCTVEWSLLGQEFGNLLQNAAVPRCLGDNLADVDPVEPGVQLGCTVLLARSGVLATEELPSCYTLDATNNTQTCWEAEFVPMETGGADSTFELPPDFCPAPLNIRFYDDVDTSQYDAVVAECTYSLL